MPQPRGSPGFVRSRQRPLRAIADFDEALALARSGRAGQADGADAASATGLFDAALSAFRTLGMAYWIDRAERLRGELAATPAAPRTHQTPVDPDGLTAG
jgi:hypothetical protein